jgi:tripartite-type tricarboxylate transporter receptor subunit TctC
VLRRVAGMLRLLRSHRSESSPSPEFAVRNAVGLLVLLAACACGPLHADERWPSKPIRVIVPYVVGGAADITARVIGQKMTEALGVSVVIENRGGANGNIGSDAVAKAAPDGYTLLLAASGPIVVNQSLYAKLPYDPARDLTPVTQITSFQYALIVPSKSPISDLPQLVKLARQQPGKLSYGSTGVGGGGHLCGEQLARLTGAQLTHVPYKGSAPALADLLGGQLSFTFDTVITTVPQIAAGTVRAFAVSGPRRASSLPNVPTMKELGYRDFDITQFQGLFVPAKTDPAIVERLHRVVADALGSPEVIQRLSTEGGYELVGSSPAEFSKLIASETASYAKLIREADIKLE